MPTQPATADRPMSIVPTSAAQPSLLGVTAAPPPQSDNLLRDAQAALTACAPQLRALAADDIATNHISLRTAVSLALAAAQRLRPHAARIAQFGDHGADDVDRLGALAKATLAADERVHQAKHSQPDLTKAARRGFELRTQLRVCATTLVRWGEMPGSVLSRLRGGNAYVDLALDLVVLADAVAAAARNRDTDPVIGGASHRAEAKTLAGVLYSWRTVRETARADYDAAVDLRARAFTALKKLYTQLRRTALYLFDDADANRLIAPFASTRGRGRAGKCAVHHVATADSKSSTNEIEASPTRRAYDDVAPPKSECATAVDGATDAATIPVEAHRPARPDNVLFLDAYRRRAVRETTSGLSPGFARCKTPSSCTDDPDPHRRHSKSD